MRPFGPIAIIILLLALSSAALRAQTEGAANNDPVFTARTRALDVAGAFSNDGYKLRDGFWALSPGDPVVPLEVFLFAGNYYWFTAATAAPTYPAGSLQVQIFNEAGELISGETYEDQGIFALGVAPTETGPYYLRVKAPAASTFALVYSYK